MKLRVTNRREAGAADMSKYIYGPIPSRRLGASLGVDLVPYKTCSYDCIYCQLGRTTRKTVERKEWVPIGKVVDKVIRALPCSPDYITLSGSGEPTLCSRLNEVIGRIKSITNIPVAVLTNGSLLWQAPVRQELKLADLVISSLDAGDEAKFRCINRPHEDISFERMLEGQIAFRDEFKGRYWLEVFLLAGYTAIEADVEKIAQLADRIKPDRVQLNTVTRPPSEPFAEAASPQRMAELAKLFTPAAEVILGLSSSHDQRKLVHNRQDLLNIMKRRPCTIHDIAEALGVRPNEVVKYIADLSADNLVVQSPCGGKLYYKARVQAVTT